MKFSTFYFSGTGNTKWAVEELNKIIIEKLHNSELISIESIDTDDKAFLIETVKNSDYIGFANPIYGGNIPPVMRTFIIKLINALANEKNICKPIYIINTYAYINGFGPICAKKLFYNSCFKLVSYVNIQLCNNISRPKLRVKLIRKDKLDQRKKRAKEKLLKMVDLILAGQRNITGIGPYLIPNIVIRKKSIKAIDNNYKVLSINGYTCRRCMICVNNCPTKSIEYKNNSFSFLSSCTACMRCYNSCPTYSILFNGVYANPKIYERYQGP